MKKIIALSLALVMLLAGLSVAFAAEEALAEKGPIAVIVPAASHGWTAAVAYYAQNKVNELGLEEGTGYKLLTSGNVNEQANQIEEIIGLGASMVVLLPHNNEVTVAADKIIEAGIPLVVFDRKVPNYDAYVGGDNRGLGSATAKFLGAALGGEGIVAVMSTPSKGSVSSERVDGFREVMASEYPNVELFDVTSDGFAREDGLKMGTDMLVAHPQIDAIFSIDDEPSLGILQAIRDAGRTEIRYLSGGGGNQAYFGQIAATTDITLFTCTYSPSMIGDAIQVAYDMLAGNPPAQKDTIIPNTIVTSENVANYLDEASPY